jgi:hypothetical protein
MIMFTDVLRDNYFKGNQNIHSTSSSIIILVPRKLLFTISFVQLKVSFVRKFKVSHEMTAIDFYKDEYSYELVTVA